MSRAATTVGKKGPTLFGVGLDGIVV